MKTYIGTKIVQAIPMSRFTFECEKIGGLITTTDPDEDGYKVVYEDGYKSWSPKDTFERCYREITDSEKKLISNVL